MTFELNEMNDKLYVTETLTLGKFYCIKNGSKKIRNVKFRSYKEIRECFILQGQTQSIVNKC